MSRLGRVRVMSPRGSSFGRSKRGPWMCLRGTRKDPLRNSQAQSIEARDPFLRIMNKIGPMANLEATRQTALAIASSEEEEEAPSPGRGFTPRKGKGKGVKTPSSFCCQPVESKSKGKFHLPLQNQKPS